MVGGAWPFLVGEAICLVDSDNERDSALLTSRRIDSRVRVSIRGGLCRGSPGARLDRRSHASEARKLVLLLFVARHGGVVVFNRWFIRLRVRIRP